MTTHSQSVGDQSFREREVHKHLFIIIIIRMLSYVGRSGHLSPSLKGSVQVVSNGVRSVVAGVKPGVKDVVVDVVPPTLTPYTMSKKCPTGAVIARTGLAGDYLRINYMCWEVCDVSVSVCVSWCL